MQSYLLLVILLSVLHSTEGWIRIKNKGGYVARFFIDYYAYNKSPEDYISYTCKTRVIDVPRNALTGHIRVERFIFYPFSGWYWKEIFPQEFYPQAKLCFHIWGTTIQPHWTSVKC